MPWLDPAWLRNAGLTELPGYTPFGEHHESGDLFFVPHPDREMHTYIVGQSGYGKSGLVENLAYHDIVANQKAVVVFDFHGDLTNRIMGAVPDVHLYRVALFDMLDESWPLGLSLFTPENLESSAAVSIAVNRILHLFTALWPETKGHAHFSNFVRTGVLTMLANEQTSLYDMYRMFTEAAYRQQMLVKVPWQEVRNYWSDYDHLSDSGKEGHNQAVLARLNALFMGNTLMQNVLGQAPGRINFTQIIEDKQVILIKLPGRTMEYEARLVGGILLAQLQAAVFAAGEDPQPVAVYLDEFQKFATPDLETLLTEGRKYRIALHLSHQIHTQIPEDLRKAARAAQTVVCFRAEIEDSRTLAPLFTSGETYIKLEDVDPHPCAYLLDYGSPEPIVQGFVDYYLRPLGDYRRGTRIELRIRGFSWRDELGGIGSALLGNGPVPLDMNHLPRMADPVPWLDDLLRRVMETRNPNIPIPLDAVVGFANAGVGFFPQVRHKGYGDPLFQPGYQYPAHLVLERDGGQQWLQEPMNGAEQLLHCVFLIRAVMQYLAANPVGNETKATDHDTAQILRTLPKRAAAIRSGDDQGIVYTLPNPEHVSKRDLDDRLWFIRAHTREEYCRPREEVERMRAARKEQAAQQPRAPLAAPAMPTIPWDERR